jgi:uncharacterized protein with ParB-like and HNH nuclease domain
MEAGKRNVTDIFNKNRVLEIPFFQRSYVWEEENWERFLDDMKIVSDENRDYFLGSIILKQKETPSNSPIGDVRGLVDGQQRLTTLCIFFKELCAALGKEDDFNDLFRNRNKDLIIKHNHYDHEVFEAILNGRLTDDIAERNKDNSVLACHKYFAKKHNVLKQINLDHLLNKIYFVGIDLGKDEDEQQIFDTINSLGVSLSTAELLKNELFRREDENLYEKTWKATFENSDRPYWSEEITTGRHRRENIDLLLQAYLTIESEAKGDYKKADSTFKNYKEFLKERRQADSLYTKETFVEGLIKQAKIYKNTINPFLTKEAIGKDTATDRLNLIIFGLNTTTIIPYLIYLFTAVTDAAERDQMIFMIENYLIRRMVCKETTKNYNNLFSSFIRNKINTYDSLKETLAGENQTDIYPSDEKFIKGIKESNLTNQQAKLFLYLLETSIRDGSRDATSILGLDEYSLEHVMPKKWRNHWNDNLSPEEGKLRDGLLLKLGNLTIITAALNSSVRDASWNDKRKGKHGKLGLAEHSKAIKIFDRPEYLESEVWNEEVINRRAEFISNESLKVWPNFLSPSAVRRTA